MLKHEKKNYLLDNSKYIFQYFEEKQKEAGKEGKPQYILGKEE